jgi:hypothetical protein
VLAGFVAAAVLPLAAGTEDTIRKTFDVAPGSNLTVDINIGGIEVNGGAGSQVVIEYTRKVSAGSEEEEERILREHVVTIDQSGDTVSIHARGPRGGGSGGSWWRNLFGRGISRNFHLKVTVPEAMNVQLKTSGGGIDVGAITGTVKANTSGGGLDFADVTGDINGHTSGGGIDLDRCKGTVKVHTSGGGIRSSGGEGALSVNTSGGGITIRSHRGDVNGHTSGGGIHVDFLQQPESDCRLDTSGGGVTVTLPANVAVNLDAQTSGGGVNSELPVTVTGEHKRSQMRGTINGGGPEVHLRSSGGSIHVKKGPSADLAELER